MAKLSTTKSVIIITMSDWDRYYRYHIQDTLDELIKSWWSCKVIEVERDVRRLTADVVEIKVDKDADILHFCLGQKNKEELIALYYAWPKEEWERWEGTQSTADRFSRVAKKKWLVE